MKNNTSLRPDGVFVKNTPYGHILKRNVHLFPLWRRDEPIPRKSERVGLSVATDLRFVTKQIRKNAIFARLIEKGYWAAVQVLAAYSPVFHVLLMELSGRRYLPSLTSIPDSEGQGMIDFALPIVREAEVRSAVGTVHFGINWSALSYGALEEKTGGLMSVPTLVHPQIWSWPPEPKIGEPNADGAEWILADDLDEQQKPMIVGNRPSELLGRFVGTRVRKAFLADGSIGFEHSGLLDFEKWSYTPRGIEAPFASSAANLLGLPGFFSRVLKPLSRALETAFEELTEALTTMDCAKIYSVLHMTQDGPLTAADLALIRAVPGMRPIEESKRIFREKGWPDELLDVLLPLIRARCAPESDQRPVETWRVGFGYALVFSGQSFGSSGVMRIMPVAQVGPAGVVEAQGIVLERVKAFAPDSELRRKGEELQDLVAKLETAFGQNALAAVAAGDCAEVAG